MCNVASRVTLKLSILRNNDERETRAVFPVECDGISQGNYFPFPKMNGKLIFQKSNTVLVDFAQVKLAKFIDTR